MNVERDILEKLADLHEQATKERSHFYVHKIVGEAIKEISKLRTRIRRYQQSHSGLMSLNCYPTGWPDPTDRNSDET